MIASHIHDALGQVRRLRGLVLDKRAFRGYSGPARMLSGIVALAVAAVLASCPPESPWGFLLGWGYVLSVALALNYGAVLWWFLMDPECGRHPVNLRPVLEAMPPLAVGALLSLALILHQQFDLLFGTWMACYGLAHLPCRQSLPFANYLVGLGYLLAGAVCLLWPGCEFRNPWPMGIVFFCGEMAGGLILYLDRRRVMVKTIDLNQYSEK